MSLRWTEDDLKAHQAKTGKVAPKKSKYKNVPTVIDSFRFDSKAEGRRYQQLLALRLDGCVSYFLRQVPFHLPGGVVYRADFFIVWADGRVTVEDVKGMVTAQFKTKKKLVEALYPVKIEIVR